MIRRESLSDDDFRQSLIDGKEEDSGDDQHTAFGITLPLLTTSTGEKFGKSAGNALWLDPERTSPFELYQVSTRDASLEVTLSSCPLPQFLLNSADADVKKYLQMLTFVPLEEIEATMAQHQVHMALASKLPYESS